MAVLSIASGIDSITFMAANTSQTTTSCPYITCTTSRYALLQGYMRVGYSPLYIYYELLVLDEVLTDSWLTTVCKMHASWTLLPCPQLLLEH